MTNLKPLHQTGGTTLEFANSSFPHISALLNPQQHSTMYPLAAEIVSVSSVSVESERMAEYLTLTESDICIYNGQPS
jgi:hypothetical protein